MAVGASILLNQFEFIRKFNDIDIKDIERTDEILKSIGEKKKWERTVTHSTKYFYEYIIDGIYVDIMQGFTVNYNNGVFEYIFDNNSVSDFKIINGVNIPFTSLEDWYVIYQLIPKREAKVNLIEKYLLSNGIKKTILTGESIGRKFTIRSKNKN